eukprot:scaffold268534_cov31-Tisochrysis_lutea.AAC.5
MPFQPRRMAPLGLPHAFFSPSAMRCSSVGVTVGSAMRQRQATLSTEQTNTTSLGAGKPRGRRNASRRDEAGMNESWLHCHQAA